MTEENIENNENNKNKPMTTEETIKRIRRDNPGVKVKRVKGGGIQIMNPSRSPSPLLTNLIKRVSK